MLHINVVHMQLCVLAFAKWNSSAKSLRNDTGLTCVWTWYQEAKSLYAIFEIKGHFNILSNYKCSLQWRDEMKYLMKWNILSTFRHRSLTAALSIRGFKLWLSCNVCRILVDFNRCTVLSTLANISLAHAASPRSFWGLNLICSSLFSTWFQRSRAQDTPISNATLSRHRRRLNVR